MANKQPIPQFFFRQDPSVRAQELAEKKQENLALMEEGLVTTKEASKFLAVSRTSIYRLMNSGQLQYVKMRGLRRIPRKALANLAEECLMDGWKY